jgi:hypothetical protein
MQYSTWRVQCRREHKVLIYTEQSTTLYVPIPTIGEKASHSEPVFVNLLKSPGIDSQPGGPVQ